MLPCILIISSLNAQRQSNIYGFVSDKSTKSALIEARVDLKSAESRNVIQTSHTDSEGGFSFSLGDTSTTYVVEVSYPEYETTSSKEFELNKMYETVNLGTIYLRKNETIKIVAKIDTIPVAQFVDNKLDAANIFPTKGAYNLLYALNPVLNDMIEIPDNYTIRYPEFPGFKSTRKSYNSRFKKDKKKGEPFISLHETSVAKDETCLAEGPTNGSNSEQSLLIPSYPYDLPVNSQTDLDHHTPSSIRHEIITTDNTFIIPYGNTKKFVFVLWKYGENGEVITKGPEVEKAYKIEYYTDNMAAQHNIASNATYGYAPMKMSSIYNIIVYNQDGNNLDPVSISDNLINTQEYYYRRDILALLNTVWTKVPIQIMNNDD